ncbi:MAG TPA: hypothetical protein VED37_06260, partial [Ktedonobacteraceae bacterium]|nr:hypothetical protein [Ktedonobacteraceae bacterium]
YVEIDTSDPERIIDPTKQARYHRATHLVSKRRPFVRHELRVDGLSEPNAVYEQMEQYCRREGSQYQKEMLAPVVHIHLVGTLAFDADSLDQKYMEEIVHTYFRPLLARIDNNTNDQDFLPDGGELDGRDRSVWHELERVIFEDLVSRDNRYLGHKEQWGAVLADLKQMALQKDDPAQIAQFLRDKRGELMGA